MVKSLNDGATAHTVLTELDDQKLFSRGMASITRRFQIMRITKRGGHCSAGIYLNVRESSTKNFCQVLEISSCKTELDQETTRKAFHKPLRDIKTRPFVTGSNSSHIG